tara:strand:- start:18295 stop:19329 length:1035 start_codon:yes stop_codon:yes gene_type:complete
MRTLPICSLLSLVIVTALHAHDEVVLGERVGPVTVKSTAASLAAALGAKNVVTEEVYIGEGQTETATVLFPGSRKEMIVFWFDLEGLSDPSMVRISRPGTPWVSPGGLTIGSTLKDLHEANGGPFELYGFEWDYGGRISSWGDGELEKHHTLGRLFLGTMSYDPNYWNPDDSIQVLGDAVFSSSHPDFAKIHTTLSEISYLFLSLMERESVGPLRLGLSEAGVKSKLPVRPNISAEVLEEATGSYLQEWDFAGMGVQLDLGTYEPGGAKEVYSITVTSPSTFQTAKGIGIGSTEAEVEGAYADEKSKEDSRSGELFVAGSIYGGLLFTYTDGKVSQIFLGAAAE